MDNDPICQETDAKKRIYEDKYIVTAIVSVFNSEIFIKGCIEDLEAQTISNRLEIIIVNSNSQENEHEIIHELQNKYDNIKYISTDYRETVYSAWNRGIKAAKGKYITNANTDDRHRQDAFERMVKVLDERPRIVLVYADVIKTVMKNETFDEHTPAGIYHWHDWDRDILLREGCFMGPQPMWRKSVHDDYGYFDPRLVSSGDYEFWLRISQSHDFHHIKMPLGLYLERPDSIEHRNKKEKIAEDLKIQSMYLDSARKGILIRFHPFEKLSEAAANIKELRKENLVKWIGRIENMFCGKKSMVSDDLLNTFSLLKHGMIEGSAGKSEVKQFIQAANQIIFQFNNRHGRKNTDCHNHEDRKKVSPIVFDFKNSKKRQLENRYGSTTLANEKANKKGYRKGAMKMKSAEELYKDIQPLIENNWNEAAISGMEKLLEAYPEYAIAHNDLGVLYLTMEENHKALSHYEKAVRLQPDNITFQKNLADFYYVKMERVEDALRIYVKVLEKSPKDLETLLITGHICVSLYKFDDAENFYRMVLNIDPSNDEARDNLEKLKRIENTKNDPKPPEEAYQKISELLENKKNSEAILELEILIQNDPDFARAHNDIGVLHYESGNKEKALMHYERAVELQPENMTFQKNLADFLFVESNQARKALEIYVGLLEINPTDVETLLATGHICLLLYRFDDARTFYYKVLEFEPWNEEARDNLEKIDGLTSDHLKEKPLEDVYRDAKEMLQKGEILEAVATLEILLEANPDFALAHNDLGVLYHDSGDNERALAHYEKAAGLIPENITFQKNLADLYYMVFGRIEDALKIYVDVLTAHPEDVETLLTTAYICLSLDKKEDAKVFFKRVLEIDPDYSEASRNLESLGVSQNAL